MSSPTSADLTFANSPFRAKFGDNGAEVWVLMRGGLEVVGSMGAWPGVERPFKPVKVRASYHQYAADSCTVRALPGDREVHFAERWPDLSEVHHTEREAWARLYRILQSDYDRRDAEIAELSRKRADIGAQMAEAAQHVYRASA